MVVLQQGCKKAEQQQPPQPAESAATEPAVTPAAEPSQIPPAPSVVLSNIPTDQAHQHVGETNTVCGLVASARFLESAKGKPTFLNFDRPFPDHTFVVVIFETDRAKFSNPPEVVFDGKRVCVTGRIVDFGGKPEIVVKDPSQIVIEGATPAAAGAAATDSGGQPPSAANGQSTTTD